MIRFIQYLLLISSGTVIFLPFSIETSATIVFCICGALFALTLANKRFSLLSAFVFAFAYMIPPEAILMSEALSISWGEEHVLTGWRVLVLAFVAVNCGFLMFRKQVKPWERPTIHLASPALLNTGKRIFLFLTIFCVALFSPMIVYGLTTGRGSQSLHNPEEGGGLLFSVGVLGYFLFSLLYTICGFWGYYFSRENKGASSFLKTLLFSSPILLIGIASGTRYVLCFMLASSFLPWFYKLKIKNVKWLTIGGIALILLFSAMKNSRYSGFNLSSAFETENVSGSLSEKIASKGSTEGLLRNMAMIDLWTETHPHTYGKSIGFLGIFWIPRAIWTEKPTQLDYWLIREYESGFGGGFSTASSFCGELFMDFGYGCILASFLLGVFMSKMDRYVEKNLITGGFFATATSGILFAWAFFMTRSILTASYPLILGAPTLWFLGKFLLKENSPSRKKNKF